MKKTLGKALLSAGIITTGIAVAGLTFTGDAGLKNIENNLNNMKTEFTQVVSDNTFLKTQYDKLEGFYDSSVTKANDTIAGLTAQRDSYFWELNALQSELDNQPTADSDVEEIQNEITRLEGELTKANTKIAELEATAKAIDDSTVVDRVVKAEYTAKSEKVATADSIPLPITPEAMALNPTRAKAIAKELEGLEITFTNTKDIEILQVGTYEGKLSITVNNSNNNISLPPTWVKFMKDIGLSELYLTYDTNSNVDLIKIHSHNGAGEIVPIFRQ